MDKFVTLSLLNSVTTSIPRSSKTISIWLIHQEFRNRSRQERTDIMLKQVQQSDSFQQVSDYDGGQPYRMFSHVRGTNLRKPGGSSRVPPGQALRVNDVASHGVANSLGPNKLLRFYTKQQAYNKLNSYVFTELVEVVTDLECLGEQFIEELKCPVCHDICFPPVLGCKNGHPVCNKCRKKLMDRPSFLPPLESNASCPTCREQNYLSCALTQLDNAVELLDFKCLFSKNGCDKILGGSEFTTHVEMECPYRPWTCANCPKLLQLEGVAEHIVKDHRRDIGFASTKLNFFKNRFFLNVPMINEVKDFAFALVYHERWNKLFILYQIRIEMIEYFWYLFLVGTEAEAQNYTADFNLELKFDMGYYLYPECQNIEWTDIHVMSIQNELCDIIQTLGLKYEDEQLPLTDVTYKLSDRTAHRVKSKLSVNIHKRVEVADANHGIGLSKALKTD